VYPSCVLWGLVKVNFSVPVLNWMDIWIHAFSDSTPDGCEWPDVCRVLITAGDGIPGNNWVRSQMDPRAGHNTSNRREISFCAGNWTSMLLPSYPCPSHYTDCDITVVIVASGRVEISLHKQNLSWKVNTRWARCKIPLFLETEVSLPPTQSPPVNPLLSTYSLPSFPHSFSKTFF
jgi:hypothetical protein